MKKLIFIVPLLLYGLFIAFVHPYFLPVFPLFNWAIPGKLLLILAPVYMAVFWWHRDALTARDYHMIYAPLVAWLTTAIIVKVVSWHYFMGRPALGPYGADKGASNALIEMEMVFLLSGLYLLRFVPRSSIVGASAKRVARNLMITVCGGAALLAILVPPLPD